MAESEPDTRINTTVPTTLLLQICRHIEAQQGRRLKMSEVTRIVFNEYAKVNVPGAMVE